MPTVSQFPTEKYEIEREFLYKHPVRNKIVRKIVEKANGNILILVDLLDHGSILLNLLSTIPGKDVYFVKGSMETEDRQVITDKMEKSDNNVVIAMSKIFSTGISVKNLPFVVFSCIGKSVVKISQSIGRAMRLHQNKTKAIIYDLADDTEYSREHFKKRIALYKKDQIPYSVKTIKI
jgi:superfamily II DNA or RNA helicase